MLLTSCAAVSSLKQSAPEATHVGVVARPYETTWKGVMMAMNDASLQTVDKERGYVQTHWVQGWGDKKFGVLAPLGSGGSWQRRARCRIWLHPQNDSTAVKVQLDIEEKPPGGAMAYRWTRVVPTAEELKDVFRSIEAHSMTMKAVPAS